MRLAVGVVLAAVMALPADAAVTAYECTFAYERARGGGWVPSVVVIEDDPARSTATVFDPVIRHFVGTPIPARRGQETRARITFSWTYTARNRGQAPVMLYRLTYYKDGRPAAIQAKPGGYDNEWTGSGTCRVARR